MFAGEDAWGIHHIGQGVCFCDAVYALGVAAGVLACSIRQLPLRGPAAFWHVQTVCSGSMAGGPSVGFITCRTCSDSICLTCVSLSLLAIGWPWLWLGQNTYMHCICTLTLPATQQLGVFLCSTLLFLCFALANLLVVPSCKGYCVSQMLQRSKARAAAPAMMSASEKRRRVHGYGWSNGIEGMVVVGECSIGKAAQMWIGAEPIWRRGARPVLLLAVLCCSLRACWTWPPAGQQCRQHGATNTSGGPCVTPYSMKGTPYCLCVTFA